MFSPKVVKMLKTHMLTITTVLGVILSIIVGISMRMSHEGGYSPRVVMYVNFLGDIFLRMIRALILPLIVSSLIAAIAPLDVSLSKKIGVRAIIYILTTTVIAVILGIILVLTIKPGGKGIEDISNPGEKARKASTIVDTLLDLIRNVFPPNVVQATLQTYQTTLTAPENKPDADIKDWHISYNYVDGTNMLGVVSVSIVFAIMMSSIRDQVPNLIQVILEFMQVMMKIIQAVIWLTPIGVFFLILAKFMEMDDIADVFSKLGLYLATVSIGIFIHGFIFLPAIYFAFTRKNPLKFIGYMGPAILTALGTSSSLATLPVSLKCVEEKAKIDVRVSRFMLPLGATINMNGTALYEAVAAIFIAQLRQIDLSIGNVIAVCITATAASIGTAGVPQAGLVTLVMVLDSIGIPAQDISLIIAIDWIVNRFRACVNILGDAYGAAIIEATSRKELDSLPMFETDTNDDSNNNSNQAVTKL
ncbi:excitatory amino acid transporter 3-like [Chironomus tepperi]|uniref:excitatory amino acid transporter 3-like n=1 Tax=Chironomus tepperi TaxID=113505 RepID=UPI00391EFC17